MPQGGISLAPQNERPSFLQVQIPSELASVQDTFEAPAQDNPKLILHVQNIHGNYESQVQISKLLQYLYKEYGFKLIFAEGAAEQLNPDLLRFFPDAERNKKLADLMAKNGELTGIEYFLMDGPKDVDAVGIEKAELYRKNYEAFKKVYGGKAQADAFLDSFESRLEMLSSRVFSATTRRLLSDWKKFEAGQRHFLPFVKSLAGDAKTILNLDLESLFAQVEWPQITRLLALQSMEKDLDQKAANKDRARLIEFLKSQNVSAEITKAIETLDEKKITMAGSDAQSRKEDLPRYLFERLVDEAGPKGFQFHDYPAFSLWAGHLILQNELDSKLLFEEIEKVFTKVLTELTVTEREKNLLELTHDEILLKKLFHLELTRKEWERVVYRKDWMKPESMIDRVEKISREMGALTPSLRGGVADEAISDSEVAAPADNRSGLAMTTSLATVTDIYNIASQFYDLARQRESVFYETIEKTMSDKKTDKAVLVTGGFHTDGLMDIFREHQINTSILMPRLSGELDNSGYVSTMLENKPTSFDLGTMEMINRGQTLAGQVSQGARADVIIATEAERIAEIKGTTPKEEVAEVAKHFGVDAKVTIVPSAKPKLTVSIPSEALRSEVRPLEEKDVKLNNGVIAKKSKVDQIYYYLKTIFKEHPMLFEQLVVKARNPRYEIPSLLVKQLSEKDVSGFSVNGEKPLSLLLTDVILSATKGTGLNIALIDPIAEVIQTTKKFPPSTGRSEARLRQGYGEADARNDYDSRYDGLIQDLLEFKSDIPANMAAEIATRAERLKQDMEADDDSQSYQDKIHVLNLMIEDYSQRAETREVALEAKKNIRDPFDFMKTLSAWGMEHDKRRLQIRSINVNVVDSKKQVADPARRTPLLVSKINIPPQESLKLLGAQMAGIFKSPIKEVVTAGQVLKGLLHPDAIQRNPFSIIPTVRPDGSVDVSISNIASERSESRKNVEEPLPWTVLGTQPVTSAGTDDRRVQTGRLVPQPDGYDQLQISKEEPVAKEDATDKRSEMRTAESNETLESMKLRVVGGDSLPDLLALVVKEKKITEGDLVRAVFHPPYNSEKTKTYDLKDPDQREGYLVEGNLEVFYQVKSRRSESREEQSQLKENRSAIEVPAEKLIADFVSKTPKFEKPITTLQVAGKEFPVYGRPANRSETRKADKLDVIEITNQLPAKTIARAIEELKVLGNDLKTVVKMEIDGKEQPLPVGFSKPELILKNDWRSLKLYFYRRAESREMHLAILTNESVRQALGKEARTIADWAERFIDDPEDLMAIVDFQTPFEGILEGNPKEENFEMGLGNLEEILKTNKKLQVFIEDRAEEYPQMRKLLNEVRRSEARSNPTWVEGWDEVPGGKIQKIWGNASYIVKNEVPVNPHYEIHAIKGSDGIYRLRMNVMGLKDSNFLHYEGAINRASLKSLVEKLDKLGDEIETAQGAFLNRQGKINSALEKFDAQFITLRDSNGLTLTQDSVIQLSTLKGASKVVNPEPVSFEPGSIEARADLQPSARVYQIAENSYGVLNGSNPVSYNTYDFALRVASQKIRYEIYNAAGISDLPSYTVIPMRLKLAKSPFYVDLAAGEADTLVVRIQTPKGVLDFELHRPDQKNKSIPSEIQIGREPAPRDLPSHVIYVQVSQLGVFDGKFSGLHLTIRFTERGIEILSKRRDGTVTSNGTQYISTTLARSESRKIESSSELPAFVPNSFERSIGWPQEFSIELLDGLKVTLSTVDDVSKLTVTPLDYKVTRGDIDYGKIQLVRDREGKGIVTDFYGVDRLSMKPALQENLKKWLQGIVDLPVRFDANHPVFQRSELRQAKTEANTVEANYDNKKGIVNIKVGNVSLAVSSQGFSQNSITSPDISRAQGSLIRALSADSARELKNKLQAMELPEKLDNNIQSIIKILTDFNISTLVLNQRKPKKNKNVLLTVNVGIGQTSLGLAAEGAVLGLLGPQGVVALTAGNIFAPASIRLADLTRYGSTIEVKSAAAGSKQIDLTKLEGTFLAPVSQEANVFVPIYLDKLENGFFEELVKSLVVLAVPFEKTRVAFVVIDKSMGPGDKITEDQKQIINSIITEKLGQDAVSRVSFDRIPANNASNRLPTIRSRMLHMKGQSLIDITAKNYVEAPITTDGKFLDNYMSLTTNENTLGMLLGQKENRATKLNLIRGAVAVALKQATDTLEQTPDLLESSIGRGYVLMNNNVVLNSIVTQLNIALQALSEIRKSA